MSYSQANASSLFLTFCHKAGLFRNFLPGPRNSILGHRNSLPVFFQRFLKISAFTALTLDRVFSSHGYCVYFSFVCHYPTSASSVSPAEVPKYKQMSFFPVFYIMEIDFLGKGVAGNKRLRF